MSYHRGNVWFGICSVLCIACTEVSLPSAPAKLPHLPVSCPITRDLNATPANVRVRSLLTNAPLHFARIWIRAHLETWKVLARRERWRWNGDGYRDLPLLVDPHCPADSSLSSSSFSLLVDPNYEELRVVYAHACRQTHVFICNLCLKLRIT